MKLTKTDKMILKSYEKLLEAFGDYFGYGYEFVLHSLEDYESSAIQVINGFHSNRTVGAPISSLALEILGNMKNCPAEDNQYHCYFNSSESGTVTKSSTIQILGENGRTIGLLCINFYMDTPLDKVLEEFLNHKTAEKKERFVQNVNELIDGNLEKAIDYVYKNPNILSINRNKETLMVLYKNGIFNIKDSVPYVAKRLGISKNTVYLHLRNIEKEKNDS